MAIVLSKNKELTMVISSFRETITSFSIFMTVLSFYFVNLSNETNPFKIISISTILGGILILSMIILMMSKVLWGTRITYSHPIFREGLLGISYLALLIVSMSISGSFNTTPIWMFVISISLFCLAASVKWTESSFLVAALFSTLFALINLFYSVGNRGWEGSLSGVFSNPNVMGGYFGFLLFFPLAMWLSAKTKVEKVVWFFPIVLFLYLVYESGSRSVLVSLFAALVTYLSFDSISKSKVKSALYFLFVSFSAILFIVVYPTLYRYEWFYLLNQMVLDFTGKEIYTGREVLWQSYIGFVNQSPLIGHGASEYSATYINVAFSAHNYFIQIAMQSGWLGVLLILLILYSVWSRLTTSADSKIVKLSAGFLIAIIVHESFEISLTQNNFSIGMIKWLILAIGTSYVIKKMKEK